MLKSISALCLGALTVVFAVGTGCGGPSIGGITKGTSSSSSGGGGAGGDGGGAGGMEAVGGAGGIGGDGGGTAGTGGTGGGGSTCVKPDDACAGCMFTQCNPSYCECAAEPQCMGIIGCLQSCSPMDANCPGGCMAKNANGFAEFTISTSCAAALCAPSCPGVDQVKPCDLCLAQQCEPQLEKCLANTQCMALIDCVQGCMGNMACEQNCAIMNANGVADAQQLFMCAGSNCTNSCN